MLSQALFVGNWDRIHTYAPISADTSAPVWLCEATGWHQVSSMTLHPSF